MTIKNSLMSSVLLASVAAFPVFAQPAADTQTDVVSPTEEGATGPATGLGSAAGGQGGQGMGDHGGQGGTPTAGQNSQTGTGGNAPGDTTGSPTNVTPILPTPDQPSAIVPDASAPAGTTQGADGSGGIGTPPQPTQVVPEGVEEQQQQSGAGNQQAAPGAAAQITPPEGFELFQDPRTLTADQLTGQTVYSPTEENISSVSDLVLDANGQVAAITLDVGGFLGFGARTVLVPFERVHIFRSGQDNYRVYIDMTREELEAQPEYTPGAEGGTGTYGAADRLGEGFDGGATSTEGVAPMSGDAMAPDTNSPSNQPASQQ